MPVLDDTKYGGGHYWDTPIVKEDPHMGSGGTAPAPGTGVDWQTYLGFFGLPSDVQAQVASIFSRTGDVNQAIQLALGYIRGTDWYKQTYPGIQEAIAKGIVRDERDYRANLNDFNQVYRQWAGRDISLGEYAGYLNEGVNADVVARRFGGEAYVKANRGDIEYLAGAFGEGRLDEGQLQALGRQQAGLGNRQGVLLQSMLDKALQKARRAFEGTLATPGLQLGENGLGAPSLNSRPPDIGR